MDYTEQFIRLNCSLMSDYKMMKLNAEMKCMGIGLYIQMILFLRRQQEYKHDFNELDLLAEQWGATVEDLQHLIKLFVGGRHFTHDEVKGIVLQVLDVVGAVVPFYFGQYAAKCLYVFQ